MMVAVGYSPIRHTMKLVNHDDFNNLLDFLQWCFSRMVEVGENIDVLLLQGRLQHDHFLFMPGA